MSSHRARVTGRRARVALAFGVLTGGLAGCAEPTSDLPILTTAANGAAEQIPATVHKPDGPGPFPAVVIMHDCSGIGPQSSGAPARWAQELFARGYVVVIPDSFTTRGRANGVCTDASPGRVPVAPVHRVRDAYATLAYARYRSVAPLLILIGEADDRTPAEPGRKLVESARPATPPVDITVYRGAHHSFDSDRPVRYVAARVNMSAPGGRGATTGGHPRAWADSIRRVAAFFGQHLR
jgi:dienelactone hydrolase